MNSEIKKVFARSITFDPRYRIRHHLALYITKHLISIFLSLGRSKESVQFRGPV